MSYRLITKATFTITAADGKTTTREVECRAYAFPKRDASGTLTVDGTDRPFYRTGGKGRGTIDQRYVYALVGGSTAFFAITEPESTALVGGRATLTSIVAPTPTPAAAPALEPTPAAEPAPASSKAPRRGRKDEAAIA